MAAISIPSPIAQATAILEAATSPQQQGPTAILVDLTGPAISRIDVLRTLDALGVAQAVPLPPPFQEDKGDGRNGKSSAKEKQETSSIGNRDLAAKLGVVDWILLSKWKKLSTNSGSVRRSSGPKNAMVVASTRVWRTS
ncbi:hypothetical protein MGN70_011306 [Eutypa lata]|nr:hypothetical protein MGN70_011306 [Eutypa lata]